MANAPSTHRPKPDVTFDIPPEGERIGIPPEYFGWMFRLLMWQGFPSMITPRMVIKALRKVISYTNVLIEQFDRIHRSFCKMTSKETLPDNLQRARNEYLHEIARAEAIIKVLKGKNPLFRVASIELPISYEQASSVEADASVPTRTIVALWVSPNRDVVVSVPRESMPDHLTASTTGRKSPEKWSRVWCGVVLDALMRDAQPIEGLLGEPEIALYYLLTENCPFKPERIDDRIQITVFADMT